MTQIIYPHTILEPRTWSRRKQFAMYSRETCATPCVSTAVSLDITALHAHTKEHGARLFPYILYAVSWGINAIRNFRYRIHEGQIVLMEVVDPSFAIVRGAKRERLFSGIQMDWNQQEFLGKVREAEILAMQGRVPEHDRLDIFHAKAVLWLNYSDFLNYSWELEQYEENFIPKVAWGQYQQEGSQILLPLSVVAHHGFADGRHIAQFINIVQDLFKYYEGCWEEDD